MTAWLKTQGDEIKHKRVARLLHLMGLEAIYPQPHLSQPGANRQVYPYVLRGLKIERTNQVWRTDITYIRLAQGFVYLVAIIDWFSRSVLAWEVSITRDVDFCVRALEPALQRAQPEIFNSERSGRAMYQSRLHAAFSHGWYPHQYGWARARFGHYVRGAAVAQRQIGRSLSQR
jgi:putative transposase